MNIPYRAVAGVFAAVILTVGAGMTGCPVYNVWEAQKRGEAELAQAEQNRQIQVAQSRARMDSAQFEADAEVIRATGVAKANKIIADGLGGESGANYLRYLWIQGLEGNAGRTIVYVPTEANLPILEAGRLKAAQQ
jgi:regulator of protease activity HflC (stomatin/prohibitin superfamily)